MSSSSGRVPVQHFSFDDEIEDKYKVPKFQPLSKKYKKFEDKKMKVEGKQKLMPEQESKLMQEVEK